MVLAQAISEAKPKELEALVAYVTGELELEGVEVQGEDRVKLDDAAMVSAIRAWAFMQLNSPDGDA